MLILGVDTSTTTASVVLVEDGKLLAEGVHKGSGKGPQSLGLQPRANHAETLLPLVENLMKESDRSWDAISAFAVAIGPGSFTGLRIGLSTVKGLAYGWEVPVIGIPTLLAVAARVTNWNGLICPLLDARKKEVYTAVFNLKDEQVPERLTDDLVCAPEWILKQIRSLKANSCLMIGDGAEVYRDLIKESFGAEATITQGDSYPSVAFAVAQLAARRVAKADFDAPDDLLPVYLRPSEAELKWGVRKD
ncbi:MAG: tRNA (adenosine(37)-N6)-threonylcarbamoyltransferase complex dimerization subunit type 1 TsaB [Deltaproteobacteria bacterium]|nr:tRNA (adenosine(37)-N6)-threonylcarbamoyltransferase complex dimerization subunit type 1 TsaB [Deltaproteobacteria bacterium]